MNYKKTMAFRVTTLRKTCLSKKSRWQNGLAIRGPNQLSRSRVTVNLVKALPVVKRSQSFSSIFIIWECHPITLLATVQRDRTPFWVQMLTNLTEISLNFQADIQILLRKKIRWPSPSFQSLGAMSLELRNRKLDCSLFQDQVRLGLPSPKGSFLTTRTSSSTNVVKHFHIEKHRSNRVWHKLEKTLKRNLLRRRDNKGQLSLTIQSIIFKGRGLIIHSLPQHNHVSKLIICIKRSKLMQSSSSSRSSS